MTIGAHLDHLGVRGGEIHNGANDNATGSAALLEMAEAMAQDPPRRSVLFILYGVEEIGLLGSRYFLSDPPVDPVSLTVNLNMDGFGRYRGQAADEIKLYALGAERICPQLLEVIGAVNQRRGATTLVTEGPTPT